MPCQWLWMVRKFARIGIFHLEKVDGCMDNLRFYDLFNSISVISGRWADDNEMLCAMEPRL